MTIWQTADGSHWSNEWGSVEAQWHVTIRPRLAKYLSMATVLEIGCGHGRWARMFFSCRETIYSYFGIDRDSECVEHCKRRFECEQFGSAATGRYSLIFSWDSLTQTNSEHDFIEVVQLLERSLSSTGAAVLHHRSVSFLQMLSDHPALHVRCNELIDWPSGTMDCYLTTITKTEGERLDVRSPLQCEMQVAKRFSGWLLRG